MNWRASHSAVMIEDNLYFWGGDQKELPMVHYNEDKRKMTSLVDIINFPTFKRERKSTTGTPPASVMYYACTNMHSNILYFGGNCHNFYCFHNSLFILDTLTHIWREIGSITTHTLPMRKRGCRMISYIVDGEDYFLLLGGRGPTPFITHTHSQYVVNVRMRKLAYTNEAHIMCVTSSPGIT